MMMIRESFREALIEDALDSLEHARKVYDLDFDTELLSVTEVALYSIACSLEAMAHIQLAAIPRDVADELQLVDRQI